MFGVGIVFYIIVLLVFFIFSFSFGEFYDSSFVRNIVKFRSILYWVLLIFKFSGGGEIGGSISYFV